MDLIEIHSLSKEINSIDQSIALTATLIGGVYTEWNLSDLAKNTKNDKRPIK